MDNVEQFQSKASSPLPTALPAAALSARGQARAHHCPSVAAAGSGLGPLRALLYLRCSDAVLMQRLQRRALQSGRADDVDSVINARLAIYHQQTVPVLDWWRRRCKSQEAQDQETQLLELRGDRLHLWDVEGEQSIEAVYDDVRRVYAEFIAHCSDHMRAHLNFITTLSR